MSDDVRISRFYRRGTLSSFTIVKGSTLHVLLRKILKIAKREEKKPKIWNKNNLSCVPLKKFENRFNCEKTHREKLSQRSPEPLCKN